MSRVHGGDIYSYSETHDGVLPLDLSANINPFGIPPCVRDAMHCAVDDCMHYPDPLCRALRAAIGTAEKVDPAYIVCGNGAADVLFRFAAAVQPQTVLLTAPTFAEYEQSLAGCCLQFHPLRRDEGFAVTERLLSEISPTLDAVYLCNPNNPTGRTVDKALLYAIAEKCYDCGVWLLVDECFTDFLEDGEARTLKTMLEKQPKLVLLRAFTKMYAVPGVRLGYCMTANHMLVEALYRVGQPWSVSVIAQACGVAACAEQTFVKKSVQKIGIERRYLADALRTRGLTVYDGEANFLLFHTQDATLGQKLATRGVLVRDCSNYRGLVAGDFRTAVRKREESVRLLAALDEICGNGI